jgi:hypothetical protein
MSLPWTPYFKPVFFVFVKVLAQKWNIIQLSFYILVTINLYKIYLTVIRFVWVSANFGSCTVVSVNGTLVEDKMRKLEGANFNFNKKCPIYTHHRASAKFSINSHEADYSV